MQRVMIIGGPGSGKSWLAEALAQRIGLPIVAVDGLVWDRGGQLRDASDIDAAARAAARADTWIIEGGNSRTYMDRLARADMLIQMAPPVWLRIWRVLRRKGASMALLTWTWRYDRVFGPRDAAIVQAARAGVQVHVLRSGGAVQAFLDDIDGDA